MAPFSMRREGIDDDENMYRVSIELYKDEWKFGITRNAVGTPVACEFFHSFFFLVLSNFHECLYNSTETRSTCFLFFCRKLH